MKHQILCALLLATLSSCASWAQPQVAIPSNSSNPMQQQMSASSLQAHLNAMQAQAQRQLGQLNGLVQNAVNGSKYSNVLEAMANVGKAIQQQISAAASANHVNIITAPASFSGSGESANNRKNEYQSIVTTDQGSSLEPAASSQLDLQQQQFATSGNQSRVIAMQGGQQANTNYREQGEVLRQDIMRRAGQLQAVVASSMDLLKNNGDQIVRRLLEHMNVRLDQAKAKADRIINEPATNDVALKALATINSGLNHLNTIISNIVGRLDQANKENQYQMNAAGSAMISQRAQGTPLASSNSNQLGGTGGLPQLLDSNKFRTNLHQLGQQFQSVLNNSQLHQQLLALRQRQQQQMALLPKGDQQQQQPTGASAQVMPMNKINTDFSSH